ncbi:hypothetical protein D3C81_533470 [compost metagenome]
MVVEVLITSCQVSLKANSGPVTAQLKMSRQAIPNVNGRPDQLASHWEKRSNFMPAALR